MKNTNVMLRYKIIQWKTLEIRNSPVMGKLHVIVEQHE